MYSDKLNSYFLITLLFVIAIFLISSRAMEDDSRIRANNKNFPSSGSGLDTRIHCGHVEQLLSHKIQPRMAIQDFYLQIHRRKDCFRFERPISGGNGNEKDSHSSQNKVNCNL